MPRTPQHGATDLHLSRKNTSQTGFSQERHGPYLRSKGRPRFGDGLHHFFGRAQINFTVGQNKIKIHKDTNIKSGQLLYMCCGFESEKSVSPNHTKLNRTNPNRTNSIRKKLLRPTEHPVPPPLSRSSEKKNKTPDPTRKPTRTRGRSPSVGPRLLPATRAGAAPGSAAAPRGPARRCLEKRT